MNCENNTFVDIVIKEKNVEKYMWDNKQDQACTST
jgi:hypothetical protein